ncbi:hypothetical protein ABZ023_34325 [Streptomyces sp. NPDC006367]|uniref:hypothetical protein n=1 Tax=unclassified Streptomyces TaxID=2593676 RepID=UPI0033B3877D
MTSNTSVAGADGAGAPHPGLETGGRNPTVRERQYLTRAATNLNGHVPGEASDRLIEAMLAEGWIYREDGDGFRLEPDEALAFRGHTAWKITPVGRWAALGFRQRMLLAEATSGSLSLDRRNVRTKLLIEMHLAEDVGGAVRLTDLGGELVRAFVAGGEGGQP